jgi:hypothetical protein
MGNQIEGIGTVLDHRPAERESLVGVAQNCNNDRHDSPKLKNDRAAVFSIF